MKFSEDDRYVLEGVLTALIWRAEDCRQAVRVFSDDILQLELNDLQAAVDDYNNAMEELTCIKS